MGRVSESVSLFCTDSSLEIILYMEIEAGSQSKDSNITQCIWKVFRPLDFFHNLILKLIQSTSIYTQYLIMTKQKQFRILYIF
jgi:hypothetical protein